MARPAHAPRTAARKAADRLAVAAYVLLILLLTGVSFEVPGQAIGHLQLSISPADALRNLALFLPLGILLARLPLGLRASIGLGVGLSLAIEVVQWSIPGRESSPWDVLANGAGVALGHGLLRHLPVLVAPPPALARRLHRAAAFGAAGVLALGSALFATALPAPPYFGHLAPDLPHIVPWTGEVSHFAVAGVSIRIGEIAESARVRRALVGDYAVELRGEAAAEPAGLSALGLITTGESEGILIVGARGADLVFAVRTWSHRLGFDGGARIVPDVLGGHAPGAPLRIVAMRRGRDLCFGVDAAAACGEGFRLGEGWTHLLRAHALPAPMREGMDLLWLLLPLALVGYAARGQARDPAPWLALGGLALFALTAAPTRAPGLAEAAVCALGWMCGRLLARVVQGACVGADN